jgi:iron complex outermembrane recepter protein
MGDAHSRADANTCAGEQSGPLIDMHISSFSMASTRRAFLAPLVSGALALVSSMSFAEAVASPETAEAEAAGADGQLATVTVTARNRSESAQDVPIPMSILQSSDLVRDNTVSIQDLTQKAPGLEATTPNSRRTGISLRGIGKSAGNDALEASVGVLVDGIFLSHPGMTYQDFTDLEQVEVLRGPQGTLLGKNTTVGALNFTTKAPSFTEEGSATFTAGERNAHAANAAFSNALIDDLLAYRVSAFVDKQDGTITNVDAEGGSTNERNRSGARLQLLLTPFPGFDARINADYAESNERSNTKPIINVLSNYDNAAQTPRVTAPGGLSIPTTAAQAALQNTGTNNYTSIFNRAYFGGYQPIVGSWDEEDLNLNVPVLTRNEGVSSTLHWQLDPVTLTLISGYRAFNFDAKNDADQTKFDTGRNGSYLKTGQQSHEFRIAQTVNPQLDYQAGLYFLHSWNTSIGRSLYGVDSGAYSSKNGDYNVLYGSGTGDQLLQASLNRVYVTNAITPDTKSYAAFGQLNWHFTDRATLTSGVRETYEDKTSTSSKVATFIDGTPLNSLTTLGNTLGASALQIASANNIRTTTIGTLYPTVEGVPIKAYALSWLVSPTYKLTDHTLLYASASAGQKSGSVQFSSTGAPANVQPEKVLDFELGIKSLLLNDSLQVDANLFQTRVRDYQQTTSVFDPATTAIKNDGTLYYQSILGNIPEIIARGLELDSSYQVTRHLNLRVGAVYNHAVYQSWHTATCPNELDVKSSTTVCDNTGRQIVAAPRFTSTVTGDYSQALFRGFQGHVWVSNVYRSQQNFDPNLSRYGVQGSYALTDFGIGIVSPDGRIEVDAVGRNVFDKRYTTSITVGSDGSIGYDGIGDPRWIGAQIHIKL